MSSTATDGDKKSARSARSARPKIAEVVAAELRRQIVTGRLKPGDKLHPENMLQAEFDVSRPTLREALRVLESESLITISRGKHGGARVTAIDLGIAAQQVGVYLQTHGTTLQDVWLARTIIEPPAAGHLATIENAEALEALERNVAEGEVAARVDIMRYADLSAEFSMLITKHCGNRTLHVLAALIYDIIRRQHEHVTERTRDKSSVDRLRQESLRDRVHLIGLLRKGNRPEAERFWRSHLENMRDLVLSAYKGPATIDVLNKPPGRPRPVAAVRKRPSTIS